MATSSRRWWAVSVALLLSLAWAAPALACTPPPGGLPSYTIAQRVAAADVVLEGTVTSLATVSVPGDTATVAVARYFKGSGPAPATITNFGPGSLCRSQVNVDDHLIFFAKYTSTDVLAASYLGQFDAIAAPDQATIGQILAALKVVPRAYLPFASAEVESPQRARMPAAGGWLPGSAALVLLATLAWRRRTH